MPSSELSPAEAERQLAAAAQRHDEVVAAMEVGGRPEVARLAATRALARGVQLVCFTLERAAAAGVPLPRLVELTGWDEDLVRESLGRGPEPEIVARIAPEGVDAHAVAQAAASFEATVHLEALLDSIRADVGDSSWSPAAADLDDLCDRLESTWRSWRQGLGRQRSSA
jgi:hypothetical protein